MSSDSSPLPPKPEVALALLQSATSIFIHLDPRPFDVRVPAWFKKQPQLVLQVGLNMSVPIPDLDVGVEGISCTLSFNRSPEFCRIPWAAIYGLVGEDGRGMIWPDSVPAEVAAAADGRATKAPATKAPPAKASGAKASAAKASAAKAGKSKLSLAPEAAPAPPAKKPRGKGRKSPQTTTEMDQEASAPLAGEGPPEASAAGVPAPGGGRRELPSYLRVVK